jgi:hypothetical protein
VIDWKITETTAASNILWGRAEASGVIDCLDMTGVSGRFGNPVPVIFSFRNNDKNDDNRPFPT